MQVIVRVFILAGIAQIFSIVFGNTLHAQCTANAGPDVEACINGPSVTLPGGGTWSGSPLVTPAGVFTPSAEGSYTLTLTVTDGVCTDTDDIIAVVHPRPVTDAGPDQTICQGQTVNLCASATSANGAITLYTWSGGPVSNSLSQCPTATPAATTFYNVTAVDVEGCSDPDQITVFVLLPPAVNAGPDLTLCTTSGVVSLTGFSPAGGTWSGPGVAPDGTFTTPGVAGNVVLTYSYTNSQGCTGTDTRTISVIAPGAINAGADHEVCYNSASFTLTPVDAGGTWSGSPLVTAGGVFTPSTSGVHNLVYTLNVGACSATDNVVVTVNALPSANAGADLAFCAGGNVVLNGSASGGESPYTPSWNNTGSLSAGNVFGPTANPLSTTTYTLTVTDNNLCTSTDQVIVTVNALPVVEAGSNLTLCTTSSAVTLSGNSPAGGTWSGTGATSGGVYTPSATPGTDVLTYTYTNAQGCTASDTRSVTVVSPSVINAGSDHELCQNAPSFTLSPVDAGGTWSGSGSVTAAGVFTPTTAGIHNLIYTLSTGVCTSTDNVVVIVNALPSVSAGADEAMCLGQSVQLDGSISGGESPYTILWNNGGTLSSNTQLTPTATPAATTNYLLTVFDNNFCMNTDAVTVTVNSLPVVNAGSDITVCDQPIATTLTGQSPAGGTWTGSGVTAGGDFTPTGTGAFVLTYTYTNANGCQASDTRTVNVTTSPGISAGADQEYCLNNGTELLSAFTSDAGTWSGPGIVDGTTGLFDPTMAGAGTHHITLTNGSGTCAVSDEVVVVVHSLPVVTAGADEIFCEEAAPAALSGAWPPGGHWEGTGIINSVAGIFDPDEDPGDYSVQYIYTEALTTCADTAAKIVQVAALPEAEFDVPAIQCAGLPVSLDNQSTGGSAWTWSFEGAADMGGFEPAYAFSSDGTYDITLTVSTAEGCTDASTQEVEIISAPDASFTVSTDDGCSPLQVHFGNTSSGNYSTYEWELDGGTESAFEPADHLFEAQDDEAEFDITLQVTNACGSDEAVHMVTVHPLPNANFDTNIVSTQCSPVSVEFINVTTGNADSYYWSFGDGTQSLDETPELNIYTTGLTSTVFGIWLYATNTCGIDSVLKEVTVLPNLVTSSFETSINSGCEPLAVDFTNSGSGATAVEYDFGGAGSAISFNSSFEFSDDGVYDVIQYATDGCGFDTSYAQITVLNSPQAVINADDADVCLGDIIHFSSVTEDAVSMEWDFDNGTTASDPGADVTYIADGDYTVTFTATAATLCTYSTTLDIAVNPLPQAAFTPDVSTSCAPLEVCFNNESTGAVSYTWTSDDGTALAGTSPCATFANSGDVPVTRTIQLMAENAAGCTHQVSAEVEVLPIPDAQFVLSQLSTCENPAATTVLASDFADNYAWTVNGTATSSDAEPVFEFDSPGDYIIVLTTTNIYECSNASEQVFEAFEPAVAAFEMSDDLVCVNEVLEWISTSTNAISWTWDFGDGTTGVGVNPQHAYESEGVYDVSLTVMSADGCEATAELPSALTVLPLPEPDFEVSAYVTSVYYATISFTGMPDGMSDYEWDFADGGTASTQQSEHTFNNTGEFPVVLQVTDASGCTAQVMHEIVITAEFSVYVPNSFTPNGDGINDTFVPVIAALDAIDNYEMHIFDRWGVEVFFSRDPYERWTGDVAGGTHFGSTDVYSYRMNVRLEGSPEFREITGFITLIR